MTQLYKKNGAVFIPAGITVEEVEELKELYDNSTKAKELLTRFVMASVYFNGKEADLVEEAEQFLKDSIE